MLTMVARGFTLIELMLALVVVAILASIAVPAFTQSLQRTRRLEAVTALTALQLAQERFRSSHAAYAADTGALGIDADASVHYRLAITDSSAQRYTAVASAIGAQAGDAACARIGLTLAGGALSLHSSGSASATECWRR